MNASEDGDAPMGEVPVLGGFQIFGTGHLGGPHRTPLAARQADALNAIRQLAESWRYKGEFGGGPWQEGHGPDPEGQVLDAAAGQIRAILEERGL